MTALLCVAKFYNNNNNKIIWSKEKAEKKAKKLTTIGFHSLTTETLIAPFSVPVAKYDPTIE